jgi:catechol 2,3-dioxygenase-like lactoylglutathione lyase family enzyme
MTHITGFFHGGITVKDMDKSLIFYRDGLQLDIEFDVINDTDYLRKVLSLPFSEIRIVYLRIPNSGFIELLEYRGLERQPASSRPSDYGAGHLCLYVDDINALVTRMRSLGFTSRSDAAVDIVSGPNIGAKVVYLIDPDGYFVELFQKSSKG